MDGGDGGGGGDDDNEEQNAIPMIKYGQSTGVVAAAATSVVYAAEQ